MTEKRTDVLNITVGCPQAGGIEAFWMGYYGHMDHGRVHYDFLFCADNALQEKQDDPILADSKIYMLGALNEGDNTASGGIKLITSLRKFLREHPYRVVHIHSCSPIVTAICLIIERMQGIPVRITHSHGIGRPADFVPHGVTEKVKAAIMPVCRYIVRRLSTHRFACSVPAGVHLYGEGKNSDFKVINNAVEAAKFRFDPETRKNVRERENISDSTRVFGCVGRMSGAKNFEFAFDIFAEYSKEHKNCVMWFVGDGAERATLEEKVVRSGIGNNVRFFGMRSDVPELLQAMDILLFPSKTEGLGLAAVEAQASGLPVLASDIVPHETRVTELITYLPLSEDIPVWVSAAEEMLDNNERRDTFDEIIDKGYDIIGASELLQSFYENL